MCTRTTFKGSFALSHKYLWTKSQPGLRPSFFSTLNIIIFISLLKPRWVQNRQPPFSYLPVTNVYHLCDSISVCTPEMICPMPDFPNLGNPNALWIKFSSEKALKCIYFICRNESCYYELFQSLSLLTESIITDMLLLKVSTLVILISTIENGKSLRKITN